LVNDIIYFMQNNDMIIMIFIYKLLNLEIN